MHARKKSTQSSAIVMAALIAIAIFWAMRMATVRTVRLNDGDPSGTAVAARPDMTINVNAASAAELAILPGLGPALAQRIVDERTQRGRFDSLDDLDRVAGIGPAIIERMRPYSNVD